MDSFSLVYERVNLTEGLVRASRGNHAAVAGSGESIDVRAVREKQYELTARGEVMEPKVRGTGIRDSTVGEGCVVTDCVNIYAGAMMSKPVSPGVVIVGRDERLRKS